MKNMLLHLFLIALSVMIVACNNTIPEPNTLSVTPDTTLLFKASGNDSQLLTITTNVADWNYIAPEWVVATKDSNTLDINVHDNKGEERTDSIVFTAGCANPVVVTITQMGYERDILSVSPANPISFQVSNNKDIRLTITTNVTDWEYTAPEWVVATKYANTLDINVLDNQGEERSDSIVFTAGSADDVILPISQAACPPRIERTVKQVVYLEVNDCNPLNLLEYNLTDGTPFFDAVILFAANINYNSEDDIVYLHNNANVQALLDNSDTYLQPLRERGIKVYLGLLGNHDAAGLAQLSAWGAEQWAQTVAEACHQYKLDGVNLDDEYSKNPILTNHWFTKRSAIAGARLAYELKKALQEKCEWPTEVSIYEYGALYDLPAVTIDDITHTQSEFLDFVVADYGCTVEPYGDLTYAQCSGASIQLAQGRTLTTRNAQNIIDKGYGWCMWFAFNPTGSGGSQNNREHSVEQFNVAAKAFYNSQLAEPQYIYHKKGEGEYDPKPYNIGLN